MKYVIVDKNLFEMNIRGNFGGEHIDTILRIFGHSTKGTYLFKE